MHFIFVIFNQCFIISEMISSSKTCSDELVSKYLATEIIIILYPLLAQTVLKYFIVQRNTQTIHNIIININYARTRQTKITQYCTMGL